MLKQISLAFALSLSFAFVFSIASCSSGGGSSGGDDTPSSSSFTPALDKEDANYIININRFAWRGNSNSKMDVDVSVSITSSNPADTTFDSVLVKISGVTVNQDTKRGNNFSIATSGIAPGRVTFGYKENNLSFGDEASNCGKEFMLQVIVYADGDKDAKSVKSAEDRLQASECKSSGSGEPPSSSSAPVISKALTSISFGGSSTTMISADQGVILSTGDVTSNVANSDIYYVRADEELKAGKAGVTIVSGFGENCSEKGGPQNANADQFVPCMSLFGTSSELMEGRYYVVRTNTETSWSTGWFLVRALDKPADKNKIEIQAWKY